jgi:hypothetical protein
LNGLIPILRGRLRAVRQPSDGYLTLWDFDVVPL